MLLGELTVFGFDPANPNSRPLPTVWSIWSTTTTLPDASSMRCSSRERTVSPSASISLPTAFPSLGRTSARHPSITPLSQVRRARRSPATLTSSTARSTTSLASRCQCYKTSFSSSLTLGQNMLILSEEPFFLGINVSLKNVQLIWADLFL